MTDFEDQERFILNGFLKAAQTLKHSKITSSSFVEREVKLSTDLELDLYFREYLETNTDYAVYSEETLGSDPLIGKCWILDPLDGSLNFSRGIPFYSTSIALWDNGIPLRGYVYDYSHAEFYSADVGKKSLLNGVDIKVSNISSTQGIKATGIPSHTNVSDSLKLFETSLESYKKLRWLGCASLSLCYVASGRVEGYEEKGIKLWDVAAGIAIVMAAGGQIQSSFNKDGSLNLLATNGVLL